MKIQELINLNAPLIAYTRGEMIEAIHRGSIVAVNAAGKILAEYGSGKVPALLRSCAKPFQLMSVLAAGADKEFKFSPEELALSAASHSSESIHIEATRSMLNKMGLPAESLHCGLHAAFTVPDAVRMAREGIKPALKANNCSGKHASMLATCLVKGWSIEDYEDIKHPLQVQNRSNTALFADLKPEELSVGIDGCTVPTFGAELYNDALSFARLADAELAPSGFEDYAARVFKIMNDRPVYGSGTSGRIEAELMTKYPGKLVAKVGAEGFFAVGIAPGVIDKHGVGLAVKFEDGISFNRATEPVVLEALHQLGLMNAEERDSYKEYFPKQILSCRHEPVGEIKILFDLKG
jgi:L-asparaginase II